MRRAVAAAAIVLCLGAAPTRPTPRPPADRDGKRPESEVRFAEPAPEIRKLTPLLGSWNLEERWAGPARYKRGSYEGEPGPGGSGVLTVRPGPGDFSLVGDYDARNPMGHVTSLLLLTWDPNRRLYELEEIHSAFPGVLRLTGRFEKGDLVFRGQDARTGRVRPVRLVWKGLGQDSWNASASEAGAGGRMEPVVETALSRASPR